VAARGARPTGCRAASAIHRRPSRRSTSPSARCPSARPPAGGWAARAATRCCPNAGPSSAASAPRARAGGGPSTLALQNIPTPRARLSTTTHSTSPTIGDGLPRHSFWFRRKRVLHRGTSAQTQPDRLRLRQRSGPRILSLAGVAEPATAPASEASPAWREIQLANATLAGAAPRDSRAKKPPAQPAIIQRCRDHVDKAGTQFAASGSL
jgi:hypothetical protein